MSEWKECRFDNLMEITSSKRIFYSEYVSEGIPFYRSKEIIDKHNKNEISTPLYISEDRYNDIACRFGVPKAGDILLTSVGSLGIPYMVNEQDKFYFKDGNLTWFKNIDSEKISNKYLLLWLQSYIGKSKLDEITIGSTQPALTINGLKTLTILLPSLNEQEIIASILGSLDDKIDLLYRQNATLEKMAETLFRQWFIEEAKEDWEGICLSEWVEVINGISYKSSDLNPSKVAMVTLKSFDRNGGFRMDGFKEFTGLYKTKHLISEGDIVVAHTDLTQNLEVIGSPAIVIQDPKYDTLVFSMDTVCVISKQPHIKNTFLYLLLKTREFKEHALGYANGSTVIHLSKDAIPEFEFKSPPVDKINTFSRIIQPVFDKVIANHHQIRSLTSMRDTLLPKLMNGEIKIV